MIDVSYLTADFTYVILMVSISATSKSEALFLCKIAIDFDFDR